MRFIPLQFIIIVTALTFVGCLDEDIIVLPSTSQEDSIALTLSGPNNVKVGESITLTVSSSNKVNGVKYSWKDGGDSSSSSGWVEGSSSQRYTKNSPGTYKFHVMAQTETQKETKSVSVVVTSEAVIDTVDFPEGSPADRHGRLQIKNGTLVGDHGDSVQLRGMSTHGIQWFDELYTKNAIQSLAENWECDAVRLSLYAREGGYESNPSYYTERVDSLIEWATSFGLYVLIDWHQLTPGDPNKDKDNAKTYFNHMASKYGHRENIIFEICNEPNDVADGDYLSGDGYPVTWGDHIKPYADEIIPIIRTYSPDNIIIVGTPKWASRPNDAIYDPINDDNVMYTLHFYAADHTYGTGSEWWPSYMDNMREAINAGLPVFVTEFGTQEATGDGPNDFYASENWLDSLDKYNVSWVNWNFSDDERSGAVFIEDAVTTTSSVADFADSSNLKEAGKWIMAKIKEDH